MASVDQEIGISRHIRRLQKGAAYSKEETKVLQSQSGPRFPAHNVWSPLSPRHHIPIHDTPLCVVHSEAANREQPRPLRPNPNRTLMIPTMSTMALLPRHRVHRVPTNTTTQSPQSTLPLLPHPHPLRTAVAMAMGAGGISLRQQRVCSPFHSIHSVSHSLSALYTEWVHRLPHFLCVCSRADALSAAERVLFGVAVGRVCVLCAVADVLGVLLPRAVRHGADVHGQCHSVQWPPPNEHVLCFEVDAGPQCHDRNLRRNLPHGEPRVLLSSFSSFDPL